MIGEKKMKIKNTNTGKRGITFRASRNRFEAQFSFMGNKKHIGTFKTLEEAVKARKTFVNNL